MERGCRPRTLTVTAHVPLPPQITCDILHEGARSATRLALYGPHHPPMAIRGLAAAATTSLQHLALDLYDAAASHAADEALSAVGRRLTSLDMQLYGGAVLPCEGLRSCTALTELRLRLSMDRNMHIGPFRYGQQQQHHYAGGGGQRRRGGGGVGGVDGCGGHTGVWGRGAPLRRGGPSGPAAAAPVVRHISGTAAGREDEDGMPLERDARGDGGGGDAAVYDGAERGNGGGEGRRDSGAAAVTVTAGATRPVPPAVAAIASLPQLRCLELYGSSIDRVLDPPNRLLGFKALRNLTRLRVELPPEAPDRFTSGIGGGGDVAAAVGGGGGGVPEAGLHAAEAAAAGGSGDGGHGWCLGPTLAALTWLQDLDLGVSYAVPPEALPSLAPLTRLTRLCCATLLTPPPQHRHRHQLHHHHQQQQQQQRHEQEQEQGQGQQEPPPPWPFLQLPLPNSLEQLQVAALPAVPLLAALAALPRLRTLTLARRDGGPVAAAAAGGAAAAAPPPRVGGAPFSIAGAAAAGVRKPVGLPDIRIERTPGLDDDGAATDSANASAAVASASAPGGALRGGFVLVPRTTPHAVYGCPGPGRRFGDDHDRDLRGAGGHVGGVQAAAAAAAAAAATACEPLPLTLVGEEFAHEHRLLAAAGKREEVAVAARLLLRLLPPAALRRLALRPFALSPAAVLEGPQAGWLSELAPLAGAVEAVEMAAFACEPGDLQALAAALPGLKVLSLYVCRMDADDVRRLQDEHPSLAIRVDASCQYGGSWSSYGVHGGPAYDNGYGVEDGEPLDGGSEEFVDEAEIQDPDLDPAGLGIWPVAVELQRAYERALDVTDDDEEEEGEEGEEAEGDEAGEEQDAYDDGGGGGGDV